MSNRVGFADNLSQTSGSNVTINSLDTNITKLQHITQLANINHHAYGGSFSIPKCSFCLVTTTKLGKLIDYHATFSIRPTPASPPEHFIQKPIGEAHQTLGIHITPNLNPKRQFELLREKSLQKSLLMCINPLPLDATYTAYQQHLQPAFLYALIAQHLPNWAINKQQSPIIIQLLLCLNLSSTMSCCTPSLPLRFGGAGIPSWAVLTYARQVKFLQSALDAQTFYGHTMHASLLTLQLEYGHGNSLLATMDVRMEGMTLTWIMNVHKSCAEFEVSIARAWTAPLQQLHDIHIATILTNNINNLTKKQMPLFCECFCHMRITMLADITNAAGTHLAPGVHALHQPVYPSIYHFRLHPFTITRGHRHIWNSCLDAITTSNQHQLKQPLGDWISSPSTYCPYCLANGSLFVEHNNELWYQHQLSDSK
mmetsp:Transcript_5280/g.7821  ORF Transcript_5280/g.7821 Transcript_5280/m.7821 type:complete len:425 (-) Transcript_5280:58-1332(-)